MKQKLFTLFALVAIAAGATAQTTHEGHEYVDLGLTSGTLWATYNVGASAPEEAGGYFAWGETQPKENYAWKNEGEYKWGVYNLSDATNYGMTKYNKTDGKTVLEAEDDAAHVNWGGDWRMPTIEEQQELLDECDWSWDSTKKGYTVTGKNGNAIFLPAAGFRYDSSLGYAGGYGYYWSSSLREASPYDAGYLEFGSGSHGPDYYDRRHGQSVRAVRSAKYTITVEAGTGGTTTGTGIYIANRPATITATPDEGYLFTGWSDGNKENPRTITVTQDSTFMATFMKAPEYVDLGLTSGTLWATFNVGANAPEEHGDYFAWGETKPKENYSWETYAYGSGTFNLTKYCTDSKYGQDDFADNLTTLEATDDAATANWGGKWRMPTNAEQDEIFKECTWTYTDNYNGTGVAGRIVTSKVDATKHIFLPIMGKRMGTSLNNVGVSCNYWASSLDEGSPYRGQHIYFNVRNYSRGSSYRYEGLPVRPVQTPAVQYTVVVTAGEGGTVTGGGKYAPNRTATLKATPAEHYVFAGWSDGNMDNPRTLTVTQDSTITANFELAHYTITLVAQNGTITGADSGKQYIYGTELTLTATSNAGHVFAGWSDGNTDNPRTVTVTQDLTFTALFAAFEYVDLGLSSGTLWATFNVGATAPEQYGDYFAWGETQPKENYSWLNEGDYKWGVFNSSDTNYGMTKYNKTDGKTVLAPEDDAATANWGGDWRMPTTAEQQELLNECTWEWTDNYNNTGVAGRIVTGTNGNSIFLPAAGYRDDSLLYLGGSYGYYWSSSLCESRPYRAYYLYFYSDFYDWSYESRYIGQSVRPVQSPVKHTITVTASEGGTAMGSGEFFAGRTATLTATPNEGYLFAKWTDENGKIVSTTATCTITVTATMTYTAHFSTYECVDLGLPSGTQWATFNVGAAAPEQYGDYFAWGETEPKEHYDWTNEGDYKWGVYNFEDETNSGMTKYNETDGVTMLETEDDAASVNWGGDWYMPTRAEMQELLDNCDLTWTTDYQGTGVSGYIVSSRATDNTNAIFFPAAGSYYQTDYREGGCYWTSSVWGEYPAMAYSWDLTDDFGEWSFEYRMRGYSVRPVKPARCMIIVTAGENGTAMGTGEYLGGRMATLTATPNEGYLFVKWTDESGKVVSTQATYTFTVSATMTYTAHFAKPTYVDLGLSSGTLWATFNVGAGLPEEYGTYFAWGEIEPKENYAWETLKYFVDDVGSFTKYTDSDGLVTLESFDDAASTNWGSDWRMPTRAELTELREECDWFWTTDYNGTGIAGYIISSRVAGNTNTIFLPAAGFRDELSLDNVGVEGCYWSSSVYADDPYAASFLSFFNFLDDSWLFVTSSYRFYGNTIRPVQSKKGTTTGVETVSHSVSVEVRKVLEDGVIYILRGDEKYMIDGRKVE